MSVSLLLIPAALAAAAAVGVTGVAGAVSMTAGDNADAGTGGSGEGTREAVPVAVQTRMKDPELLARALADIGASRVESRGDVVAAAVDDVEIEMSRTEDDVWAAHLRLADGRELAASEAAALIARLDVAYAARVQRAVAERIRARADAAGFELVSETRDDDDTVTMVLNVKDYA